MLEYGVVYRKDSQSPALADVLEIVDELSTPLARDLPPDYEVLPSSAPARDGSPYAMPSVVSEPISRT